MKRALASLLCLGLAAAACGTDSTPAEVAPLATVPGVSEPTQRATDSADIACMLLTIGRRLRVGAVAVDCPTNGGGHRPALGGRDNDAAPSNTNRIYLHGDALIVAATLVFQRFMARQLRLFWSALLK